jgi:hypothetical protein
VIIGAGQVTKKEASPVNGDLPVHLMTEAVKVAAENGGLTGEHLQKDDLRITTSLFSDHGIINLPGCVVDKRSLSDTRCRVSGFGGITGTVVCKDKVNTFNPDLKSLTRISAS